jgi:hypothetical protein
MLNEADALKNPNFSPKGEPSPIDSDKDFTDATNDISADARETLSAYLGNKTKRNSFPVSSAKHELLKGPHVKGTSLKKPSTNQKHFTNERSEKHLQSAGLGVNAKPLTFFTDDQINKVLSKTGALDLLNGHTLLSTIPGGNVADTAGKPEDATQGMNILKSIHEQLKSANKFNPDNIVFDPKIEENDKMFSVQRKLGEFDKKSDVVTAKQLADNIGLLLAAQARDSNPEYEKTTFLTNKFLGGNKNPSTNYLLSGSKAASTFSDVYPYSLQKTFPVNGKRVDYHPGRDFETGISANGPGILEVTKTAILSVIAAAFAMTAKETLKKNRFVALNQKQKLFSLTFLSDSSTTGLLSYGKRESRRYWDTPNKLGFSDRLLGGSGNVDNDWYKRFADFDNDFTRCVGRGILLFFGDSGETDYEPTKIDGIFKQDLPNNVKQAPGYYLSLMRALQISGLNLTGANAKNITSSKIYNFVMTMAGLGDVALKSERGTRDVTPSERLLTKNASRFLQPTVLAAAVITAAPGDTRLKIGGALLGTFRKHASRWSPAEFDTSGGANPLSLHTFYSTHKPVPGVGRASTTPGGIRALTPSRNNVEMIENALESEYMPFYIHDLRTHDIISMPAFITDFGESFTPSYSNVEGIGRQDPVRLYQKTERAVTFGFMLVAYNEEDFDHLWLTINKLVSMCYPQYSSGRKRSDSDGKNKFIQPFSQVQAASPMVRLRLGDVFKSNYSKFGLARLFGANAADPAAKGEVGPSLKLGYTAPKVLLSALELANAETDLTGVKASQTLYDEGGTGASGNAQRVTNYVSNDQADDVKMVTRLGLDLAADAAADAAAAAAAAASVSFPKKDFFDKDKNAIVRSFESTRGRGVAGFINSLALDYNIGSSVFETKMGRKAPKIVKISLGFLPITDLPLGLDFDGTMRNPSHPVGRFAGSFGDVYDDITAGAAGGTSGFRAKDFNQSVLGRKAANGQVAADVLVGAAFAADDGIGSKP